MTDKSKQDGGPAFPTDGFKRDLKKYEGDWGQPGMSLRQWYAGMALMGLLSNPAVITEERWGDIAQGIRGGDAVSKAALMHADALIARSNEGDE